MDNVELLFKHEIERFFGIHEKDINEFRNLEGSNPVYSFIVKEEKYIIKKLNDSSIVNWEQEKSAYNSLKPLNITDELVYYDNGIKITIFINNSKKLSYNKAGMADPLLDIAIASLH